MFRIMKEIFWAFLGLACTIIHILDITNEFDLYKLFLMPIVIMCFVLFVLCTRDAIRLVKERTIRRDR